MIKQTMGTIIMEEYFIEPMKISLIFCGSFLMSNFENVGRRVTEIDAIATPINAENQEATP